MPSTSFHRIFQVVLVLVVVAMSFGMVLPPFSPCQDIHAYPRSDNHYTPSGNITTTTTLVLRQTADDWPTNILFTAGPEAAGFMLPRDGQIHSLEDFQCLAIPSNSIGDCSDLSVSQVGVAAGTAPCTFYGVDGFTVVVTDEDRGFITVAPPQNILYAACG